MERLFKRRYLWPIMAGAASYSIYIILAAILVLYIFLIGDVPEYFQFRNGSDVKLAVGISLYLLIFAAILFGEIMYFILVYQSWKAIQDGHARTTPGKAVGLLFIPLFNLYWIFQVWYGFAQDYNNYIERSAVNAPKLNQRLFLIYCIITVCCVVPFLGYLAMIATMVVTIIVANATIDAVNILSGGLHMHTTSR